jgi:hypothetical protein
MLTNMQYVIIYTLQIVANVTVYITTSRFTNRVLPSRFRRRSLTLPAR